MALYDICCSNCQHNAKIYSVSHTRQHKQYTEKKLVDAVTDSLRLLAIQMLTVKLYTLTKAFMKQIGCSPRFSSSNHPECQGMCERYNQTFKNMLHRAERENGSQWHLVVPFLVSALREVKNEVTGVSPFMCVCVWTDSLLKVHSAFCNETGLE